MPYATAVLYFPDELIATMRTRVNRVPKGTAMRGFMNEVTRMLNRGRGEAYVNIASAVASQTVTCDHTAAVADTDKLTIAGHDLSAKAAVANEDQFLIGATDAAYAANVAACINANSTTSKIVWAAVTTAASGIITIYSVYPGPIGNLITLAETGNGFTLGDTALASGSSDAMKHYQLGYGRAGHVAG